MFEWIIRIIAWASWFLLTMLTLFVGSVFVAYWLGALLYKIVEWIGEVW